MRIHLDLLGGLAGDMFIAALLDAFPEHEAGVLASIGAMDRGRGGPCRSVAHRDAVLVGRRFEVDDGAGTDDATRRDGHGHGHAHAHAPHAHPHSHPHADAHTSWRSIRASLVESELAPPVRRHALAIFELLAEAEAQVHGVAIDDVAFHEVGAWDSIADIVGAAHLIAVLDAQRWSVSAIPLGFGRVRTAHGPMPVPAPATARLLAGFATLDDGIGGERVTPTGAALIRHLCLAGITSPLPSARQATLRKTGIGFGTRVLPGISNCVRVVVFDKVDSPVAAAGPAHGHRRLAVLEFEVDDQSAEDLAMGLEHLRAHAAVFDVTQAPVFGKKGRMMTAVRVLAAPDALTSVIDACFRETTTIGLRHHVVDKRRAGAPPARGRPRARRIARQIGRAARRRHREGPRPTTSRAFRATRHGARCGCKPNTTRSTR